MKHVRVDPQFRFEQIAPDGITMYDSVRLHDLEVGDIVHYKMSDGAAMSLIVTTVEPAGMAEFDRDLQIVHLDFIKPPEKKEHPVFEEEYATAKWRTGRTVGRTIYAMRGAEASETDALIGMMDTPALAKAAVEAHNKATYPDEGLWAERV